MSKLLNKHIKAIFIILLPIILLFGSYAFVKIKHEIASIHLTREIDRFIKPRQEDFRHFFNKSGYRSKEAYIAHGGGDWKFYLYQFQRSRDGLH